MQTITSAMNLKIIYPAFNRFAINVDNAHINNQEAKIASFSFIQ